MYDPSQPGIQQQVFSPFRALLLGLLLAVGCYLLSNLAAAAMMALGDSSWTSSQSMLESAAGRNFLRLILGITNLGTFGLAAFLWARYTKGTRPKMVPLLQSPAGYYVLAILTTAAALPLAESLLITPENLKFPGFMKETGEWLQEREVQSNATLLKMLGDMSAPAMLLNMLVICLVPAVSEELFFRGFFQGTLSRMMNGHIAVWLSAFLFSAVHISVGGFIARLVMGALLGYYFLFSGNIKISMLAHFFHNLLSLILVWLALAGVLPERLLTEGVQLSLVVVSLSAAATVGLLYIFGRNTRRIPQIPTENE